MRIAGAPLILLAAASTTLAAQQPAAEPTGPQLFQLVCSMCHSVTPPPKAAPPMSHAAAFYALKFPQPDSAAAAIVAYLKAPAAERSLLPKHAIERFGLMPAQSQLSEVQLAAVAKYVLTLADTAHVGMMHPGGI